ncbi:hypothetical protein FRB90_001004 [Tulasnella sp. 427]|nr:hypothetical protein FRB90_001004 [Tulasnella sp. 427]
MATQKVFIAHYGHVLLRGPKHWVILLQVDQNNAIAYQITGSSTTYEVKAPETVKPEQLPTLLGMVQIGEIATSQANRVWEVLQNVPVTRNVRTWNSQDWVVLGLGALKSAGLAVDALSKEELLAKLDKVTATPKA